MMASPFTVVATTASGAPGVLSRSGKGRAKSITTKVGCGARIVAHGCISINSAVLASDLGVTHLAAIGALDSRVFFQS